MSLIILHSNDPVCQFQYADVHVYETTEWLGTEARARYAKGQEPPRYPVPATMDNAVIALFHSPAIIAWSVQWFERELRKYL